MAASNRLGAQDIMQGRSTIVEHSTVYGERIRLERVSLKIGVEIHYAERGIRGRQTILFLHGYADSWHSFGRVFAALPRKYPALAPDLRGHGDSDKPAPPYTLEVFTEDLLQFMNALELETVDLVGHSMGSLVAQSFAARHPERVGKLVLISSAASMLDNSILNQIKPSIEALRDPVDRKFVVEFQTPSSPIPEAFMQDLISESLKVPAHVWKGVLAGLLRVDNRSALPCITAPTLVLWGNEDSIFTRKDQDDLLERISDSRFIEYTAGHALHWEKPDEVAADLINFVD